MMIGIGPAASPRASPRSTGAGSLGVSNLSVGSMTVAEIQRRQRAQEREAEAAVTEREQPSKVPRLDLGVARASGPPTSDLHKSKPGWECLPAGTALRVWWDGCDEAYHCRILDWRVSLSEERALLYTHRCQYEGGVIEHDLSKTEFEVCDPSDSALDHFQLSPEAKSARSGSVGPSAAVAGSAPESEVTGAENVPPRINEGSPTAPRSASDKAESSGSLTPRRRRLLQHNGGISPRDTESPRRLSAQSSELRGRVAMRRIRSTKATDGSQSPMARVAKLMTAADLTMPSPLAVRGVRALYSLSPRSITVASFSACPPSAEAPFSHRPCLLRQSPDAFTELTVEPPCAEPEQRV